MAPHVDSVEGSAHDVARDRSLLPGWRGSKLDGGPRPSAPSIIRGRSCRMHHAAKSRLKSKTYMCTRGGTRFYATVRLHVVECTKWGMCHSLTEIRITTQMSRECQIHASISDVTRPRQFTRDITLSLRAWSWRSGDVAEGGRAREGDTRALQSPSASTGRSGSRRSAR